ncbi:MAG: alpha-glucosidase, partial [Saprospiraceae bacterium]|nr:alpha-glucosidase [Saprospiraceae bacterium]
EFGAISKDILFTTVLLRMGELSKRPQPIAMIIGDATKYPVYDQINGDRVFHIVGNNVDVIPQHEEVSGVHYLSLNKLDNFDQLLAGIHDRGMKLVMDLVVNHTSDEHFWFQEARKSPDNPYRDYYIWHSEPPNNWQSMFGGSAWQYDELAEAYYLHLFTRKQPDLNWENPKVREEVYQLMRFWLDKGVDGFRMDVIPMISKRLDWPDADFSDFNTVVEQVYCNGPRVHAFLQEMHREVIQHYDMMTVGEGVGIPPTMANDYVGKSRDELNMIFHFGHMFIDHGPGGKFDVIDIDLPTFKKVFIDWDKAIGHDGWLNIYLDNHDFPRLVSRFGDDTNYREESAKMLGMLLLSLRGTPCIYQGTEIGMTNVAFPSFEDYRDVEIRNNVAIWKAQGDDLDEKLAMVHIQARDNVRTPIQWSNAPEAGFSTGTPWIKVNPNFTSINVAQAEQNPESVLHFYRDLLAFRKQWPVLVYGTFEPVAIDDPTFFAFYRKDEQETIFVVFNFSGQTQNDAPWPTMGNWTVLKSNYKDKMASRAALRPWEGRILKQQ